MQIEAPMGCFFVAVVHNFCFVILFFCQDCNVHPFCIKLSNFKYMYKLSLIQSFVYYYGRCAGLCCYEGRGGLCSIRLSEPLLKLRPRKDLVQTLLVKFLALVLVTGLCSRSARGPQATNFRLRQLDKLNFLHNSEVLGTPRFHSWEPLGSL